MFIGTCQDNGDYKEMRAEAFLIPYQMKAYHGLSRVKIPCGECRF